MTKLGMKLKVKFSKDKGLKKQHFFRLDVEPTEYFGYYEILVEYRKLYLMQKLWNLMFDVIPDEVFVVDKPMLDFLIKGDHERWVQDNIGEGTNTALTHEILEAIKNENFDLAQEKMLSQFSDKTKEKLITHLNKQPVKNLK